MSGPTLSFVRAAAFAAGASLFAAALARADVGTFVASKDNTMYEPGVGSLSNGGTFANGVGDFIFVGRTGQSPSLSIRRALLAFDLSSLPADATVNGATLSLHLSRSAQAGAATVSLHRAMTSWGEGMSHAPGQEGEGGPAEPGDATWIHRFWDPVSPQPWTNPGGDFDPVSSATTTVGTSSIFYSWSGAPLAADVQGWIANPAGNFGWVLLGDEERERTAKRFASNNNTTDSRRPRLIIDYSLVAAWANPAGGNWSEPGNWSTGAAPNGIGAAAKLGSAITQPSSVTLDVPVTLGRLTFDNTNAYTVAGTNALTLAVSSGSANVAVANGAHLISAPLVPQNDTTFNIAPASGALTLTNLADANGLSLTKTGAGVLEVNRVRAAALAIDAGTVKVLPNGTSDAVSVVESLTIAGGSNPAAQLDLSDNAMVIEYESGSSPLATVRAQVTSGYNDAQWDGPGIICSGPGSGTTHGMGYAEASSLFTSFPATFLDQSVDETSILLRRTRYGDANLDGVVNLSDFNRLAANFGLASGAGWSQGDFNYDGIVNLSDFNRLAGNFGQSAGPDGVVGPDDWAHLAAAVPEPGVGGLAGVAGFVGLLRRRRR